MSQVIPGRPVSYFVLNRGDYYYQGFQKNWSPHLHYAAMLSEELAETLQRRYPQATIEQQEGYGVDPIEHLKSVGEPEATQAVFV